MVIEIGVSYMLRHGEDWCEQSCQGPKLLFRLTIWRASSFRLAGNQ